VTAQAVVWVTRTQPGADRTARAVEALGHEAVVAPVLEVVPLPADFNGIRFDAVIFTGGNALDAFCRLSDRRDVTAWCVGDTTAEAARAQGFQTVMNAEGDAEALFKLIKAKAPRDSLFVYPAPKEPAAPLLAWMWAEGLSISQIPVYETHMIAPEIDLRRITHVLVHSAKAARALADLLGKFAFTKLCVIFISDAASNAFDEAWAQTSKNNMPEALARRISPFPDEASMLKRIETS
jgi:uroporphyrinogen-III synthase